MWPWKKKVDRMAERSRGCRHVVLAPRWADAAAVGHLERATGYWCAFCNQEFTVAEAMAIEQQRRPVQARAA